MKQEILAELLAALSGRDGVAPSDPPSLRLVKSCTQLSGWAHAVLVLEGDQGEAAAQVASSSLARTAVDLERRNGQGPSLEAATAARPVLVADFANDGRWPQSSADLARLGLRAAAALPLRIGAIALGILTFYDETPERADAEVAETLVEIADVLTSVVLGLQHLEAGSDVAAALRSTVDDRAVVHQATGMIAVQLDCPLEEALLRLRAHAFASDQTLVDAAVAVVTGALRFTPDPV